MTEFDKMAYDIRNWLRNSLKRYAQNIEERWKYLVENYADFQQRGSPASTFGQLTRSITSSVDELNLTAIVGTPQSYAEYVEQGRSAGPVPAQAIARWLQKKIERYGWAVTDFQALLSSILEKIRTQGYSGWEHLKSVIENERLFDSSFELRE